MTRLTILEPGRVVGPPIPFVDSADAPALSFCGQSYPVTWAAYPNGAAFWAVYTPDGEAAMLMLAVSLPRHDEAQAVYVDLTRAMDVLCRHVVAQGQKPALREGALLQYGRHVGHGRYVEDTVASTLLHRHEVVSAGDLVCVASASG